MLAGCVADPATESDEQAATTAFANDRAAFDFFINKGLTAVQAAGIVGNLDQESGVDPSSVQYGGGPGRGIAQWSVGGRWDTSAGDNVTAYASQQGMSRTSLTLQLDFIWFELTQIGYGYSQLKAATTVTDATLAFMDRYEICGTCASSQRISYANAVLAAYGGDAATYNASYVSQSWPLATMPLTLHCGERVGAEIVLKNTGGKTWNTDTKLGTTEPRDRTSMFADDDWLAPNRAAAISGTVAPGANGTFTFSFQAPAGDACVPGTYHEHFGLVQEATTWFADDGGPPDDQIEALIEVVPADGSAGSDYSGGGSDGGTGGTGGGGEQMAAGGCSAGGGGASLLVLVGLGLVRRRRQRC